MQIEKHSGESTVKSANEAFMPFNKELVNYAMSRNLTRFNLIPTSNRRYFGVDLDLSGAPKYAVGEWGSEGRASSEAFQYLAAVCAIAPDFMGEDGKTVEERVLEHIRSIIAGGNEWGCSGNGLSAQGYYPAVLALTIIKTKAPRTWNKLTDDEKAKADLLMEATLIGAHYSTADANYSTAGGGLGPAPALWTGRYATRGESTGVDQTGNYNRNWNPNHRVGILTAICAYYYFGGAEGGAEYCNNVLANFNYNDFMARLDAAGFVNIYTVFSNAGNAASGPEAQVSLQLRTTSSAKSDAGEYMYFGNSMRNIGNWLKEFIVNGLGAGPIRPYGGDKIKPRLTPKVENYPPFSRSISIVRPFGYPGYLDDVDDVLLNFPNLGAPGMYTEFDTSDAFNEKGPDVEAYGARSSVGYVSEGAISLINAFYILNVLDGFNESGTHIAGISRDEYSKLLTMTVAGIEDFLYKAGIGYQGYSKGMSRPNERCRKTAMNYCADIWKNIIDRPMDKIEAVNAAATVAEMRSALEDPAFGLVLFQYNGLSESGKDAVADAVMHKAQQKPYLFKYDIQADIAAAVAQEAVKEFNALLKAPGTTAKMVLDALSVNLNPRQHDSDYIPNALGIFVYGFTDMPRPLSNPNEREKELKENGEMEAKRLAVAEYVLKKAPESGYADRRAIRDAIIAGLAKA